MDLEEYEIVDEDENYLNGMKFKCGCCMFTAQGNVFRPC